MLAAESGWPLGHCAVSALKGGSVATSRQLLDASCT
jgi:hypothetical protein